MSLETCSMSAIQKIPSMLSTKNSPLLYMFLAFFALVPPEWLAVDHAPLLKPCILLPPVGHFWDTTSFFLGFFTGPPCDALQKIPVCSINAIQKMLSMLSKNKISPLFYMFLVFFALVPQEWLAVDHALLLKPCILLPPVGRFWDTKCFWWVFSPFCLIFWFYWPSLLGNG